MVGNGKDAHMGRMARSLIPVQARNLVEAGKARVPWGTLRQAAEWVYDKAVDGVPGLDGADELAAHYRARHPSAEAAIAALIREQTGKAGIAGFVTGCGGFAAWPIAMPANLASALYIQLRLIAAIAHLRGHDIRSDKVRRMVLACLSGSKAADTLKDAGIRFGTRLTRDAIGWAGPAVFNKLHHATGWQVAARAGSSAVGRLGRFVPLVSGVVAGGFDAAMTQLIGRTADRVFAKTAPAG
jgi:EcsC family protein